MMQGGWEFVGAAYGVAYGALALYGLSLYRRVRADLGDEDGS